LALGVRLQILTLRITFVVVVLGLVIGTWLELIDRLSSRLGERHIQAHEKAEQKGR
jgi:hypothetical protein